MYLSIYSYAAIGYSISYMGFNTHYHLGSEYLIRKMEHFRIRAHKEMPNATTQRF